MSSPTTADPTVIRRAVEDVADPELPPVTIGMLGMVASVQVSPDGHVEVVLLPTFSGCPATEMIERDVVEALRQLPGVADVTVRFSFDPPWTADRIDATGRARLREFGITPPGGTVHRAVTPEGRPTLPMATRWTVPASRPCPYCGSSDTTLDTAFGPTPCRDLRFCTTCQQPFEAFKQG